MISAPVHPQGMDPTEPEHITIQLYDSDWELTPIEIPFKDGRSHYFETLHVYTGWG